MYQTVEVVRKESGDPHPEDVTEQDYIDEINAADAIIRNATQHDWQPTDSSFSLVQKISKLLAASFIIDKYDDPKGEGEAMFDKGMILLQQLVSEDEFASDVIVTSPDYKTWPLNPNARISRGRLFTTGLKPEQAVDPDDIYSETF